MTGFAVDPAVVRGAGRSLGVLRDCLGYAVDCLNTHARVEPGGLVLSEMCSYMDSARSMLVADYSPGGDAYRALDSASVGLIATANDYVATDRARAAQYDRVIDPGRGASRPIPDYPDGDGDPDIYPEYYSIAVNAPGNQFHVYNMIGEFYTGLEYILGLEWITEWFSLLGIANPFEGFRETMEGDWDDLGEALAAMYAIQAFWEQMQGDVLVQTERFRPSTVSAGWTGNAADASTAWLNDLAKTCGHHAMGIYNTMSGVEMRVVFMYSAMDALLDLVEDFIGLLPYGEDLDAFLKALLKDLLGGTAAKLVGLALKMLLKVRLIVSLAFEIVGLIASLVGAIQGIDFPETVYVAADVDGP